MKAVMSLWTGTPRFKFDRQMAALYTSSVSHLHRIYDDTELVCDMKGLEIADRLGWRFTSFSTALEDFCPEHAKHVWMLGKLEASRIQTGPHIHIDLDFIIKSPIPDRIWCASVAVQSKDQPHYYFDEKTSAIMDLCGVPRHTLAYNAGILLWRDLETRDEYCRRARCVALTAAQDCPNGTTLSIVAEQAVLGQVLRERRIMPVECIPLPSQVVESDFDDFKFCHVWGRSKLKGGWLELASQKFEEQFPKEYNRFDIGFQKLVKRGIATSCQTVFQ